MFNWKTLPILLHSLFSTNFPKPYNCHRKFFRANTNSPLPPPSSPASHLDDPFLSHKQLDPPLSSQTLMFHVEGALLKSPSVFPYFLLVAFEGGSPVRALVLLLLYPLLCLAGDDLGLKLMVFVSFVGIRADSFRIGRTVLPKFFLEDVGEEGFDFVRRFGETVAITDLPTVMVDWILRYYLGIQTVVGRELKVVNGYFVGVMEEKKSIGKAIIPKESINGEEKIGEVGVVGFGCFNQSLDQQFLAHCKVAYLVSEAEKRTWRILPRKKYPKPLVFHDGRLAFRPNPLATLAMFIWLPFGIILFLVRAILGLLLPFRLSVPLLSLTGMRGTVSRPKDYPSMVGTTSTHDHERKSGTLYVCNHRTLFDPLYASIALMRPLTAVTYSLSRAAELLAPIKTVRLTRNRDKDFELIRNLLSRDDLVICPEGTTCREPCLLRFSPLFAETTDRIIPMAIRFRSSMFYATTASGFKCLDPVFLLINPFVTCNLQILEMVPQNLTCTGGGKSKYEVANYVQEKIAKALDFDCTKMTRRDKYMFLAGNEGVV